MKNSLWVFVLMFMLAGCAFAKDAKYWIDLESADTQGLQYGALPISAEQGDLDNDGVMDVVVGTSNSPAGFLGNCIVFWNGTTPQNLININDDNSMVALEDLDNNGYKDIICRERVFYNQGNREFIRNESDGFLSYSKFADLDDDGTLDNITTTYWKNGNDGSKHELSTRTNRFHIIDMNNDGRLDIFGVRYDLEKSFWYMNTGSGPLFGNDEIITETKITPCDAFDFDYDNDLDLFVINAGVPGFLVNNGGLLPINFWPLFKTTTEGFTADVGNIKVDIDSDGDWDLFGYNYDTDRFYIVEQIGYRSLNFEFNWISDKVSINYWVGYLVYQNAGETYYYFRTMTELGVGAKGSIYRTPIVVQKENAVSFFDWTNYQ